MQKTFIEKLILRLKSGDARSIHLNALPGNFARLDVFELRTIQQSLHLDFLQEILSKENFTFKITLDFSKIPKEDIEQQKSLNKTAKRLNHLYYQEKEALEQFGYSSFGFGYPMLIFRDTENPKKIIKAPLFIWYVDIKKDTTQSNTWKIQKADEHAVLFNEVLQSYLERNFHLKTDDIADSIEDEFLSERKLIDCCANLMSKLNAPFDKESAIPTVLPCTNKESIEILTQQTPWIRWSGVLGMYKTQKQSIINDLENLAQLDEFPALGIPQNDSKQALLTTLDIDSSQEEVVFQTLTKDKIIIQGPPGTGKSQTLTSIILQALLHEKKTLMVCEKRTALEVIQKLLAAVNLDHLSMLIDDVYTDRNKVIEAVRAIIDEEPTSLRFKHHDFTTLSASITQLRNTINQKIKASQTDVLNDDSFEEIIIELLSKKDEPGLMENVHLLSKNLRSSDYVFTSEEYNLLLQNIEKAEQLSNAVHPEAEQFQALLPDNFKTKSAEKISQQLHEITSQLHILHDSIEFGIVSGKKYFDEQHGIYPFLLQPFSIFSSKYKTIKAQKEKAIQDYHQTLQLLQANNLLQCNLSDQSIQNKFSDALPTIKAEWKKYESLSQHAALLYDYTNFQAHYLLLEPSTQQIITLLRKSKITHWKSCVNYWYKQEGVMRFALQNKLHESASTDLIKLNDAEQLMKTQLAARINAVWRSKINEEIAKKDKTQLKYLYNLRKNKQYGARNTLRKIIHDDTEFFSTLFPVVFVNPTVCTSIFPLNDAHFDYVIFDESSQLRLEDTYTSLLRGKQKIISGDRHQMPPSAYFSSEQLFYAEQDEPDENEVDAFLAESNSLLEYADSSDYTNTQLNFHYRSEHPDLIRFSNAAFYENRLIPMPELHPYQAIKMHTINGTYADGTNEAEADAVVNFIFSMDEKIENLSIGIATFNIFQRDLILDKLYERASESKALQDKLNVLLQKGLFVKNLENIQGDERDIILISTTFGNDQNGKFRQLFGPLSTQKGYQLLNVIITRAKKQLHVFSSFPESAYSGYEKEIQEKGNTGKGILYAFLMYVQACHANHEEQKNHLLDVLSRNQRKQFNNPFKSIYKEQIELFLQQHFPTFNIEKNKQFGGFVLDFVLKKHEKIVLCIDLENENTLASETDYRNKLHKEEILSRFQIPVYHLWLYDFWKKQDEILREIAQKITYEK